MLLNISNIAVSRGLEEKLVENQEAKMLLEEFQNAFNNGEEFDIYLAKSSEIEYAVYIDSFTQSERKTGLKFVEMYFSIKNKYIKARCNISWNTWHKKSEIYFIGFSVFGSKKQNGVHVKLSNGSTIWDNFESQFNLIAKHPNFLQRFEDTSDMLRAIELYETIVNKLNKGNTFSIAVSDIEEIKMVFPVDKSALNQKDVNFIDGKIQLYVEADSVSLLPTTSYDRKNPLLMLVMPKRKIPIGFGRIMKAALSDGKIGYSENPSITSKEETIKLVDFKEKAVEDKKRLYLFVENQELSESKFIHIYDRLSMLKAETMMSVFKSIKENRLNNNNLFQFLFNNGSFDSVGNLSQWEINHEFAGHYEKPLNESQKVAFNLSIDSHPITFIQGPPGTGKTFVISQICKYYNAMGKKVLVSSQTNVAVENILENLWKDMEFKDIAVKAGYDKSSYTIANVSQAVESKLSQLLDIPNVDLSFTAIPGIHDSNIVGSTTTSSALDRRDWKKFSEDIDVLIVDEISKSSVPELIRFVVNSKKIIFVGDQKQLAPLDEFDDGVWDQYEESDKKIIEEFISVSIFDKLFAKMQANGRAIMLNENRRSVKSLADIYSLFYGSQLKAIRKDDESKIVWKTKPWYPFTFIAMNGSLEVVTNNKSRENIAEAEYINVLLEELSTNIENSKDLTIAIIAMYGAQVKRITEVVELNKFRNNNFKEIKVNTVDAFQGDQADIVIISSVRADSKLSAGFISDYRRVNVAISRAKDLLVFLGNDSILKNVQMPFENKQNRTFFNDIFNVLEQNKSDQYDIPMKRKDVAKWKN